MKVTAIYIIVTLQFKIVEFIVKKFKNYSRCNKKNLSYDCLFA
jgi:hypothetical protein